MPTEFSRLDIAELLLVGLGIVVILGGTASIRRRGSWNKLFTLPPQPANVLEPADLLIGLAAMVLLPSIFYQLLAMGSPPATSSPNAVEADISDPRQVWALVMGQTLGIFFIAILCRQRFVGGLSGWGLTLVHVGSRGIQALAGYVAIWPVCFGLLYLTVFLIRLGRPDFKPPEHSAILTLLSHDTRRSVIVMTILSTVVLAPTLEELFFRGLVQPALARWSGRPWLSIFVAGAAFGLFHYPLVHTIPALTLLGAFLGFLYARSRSLTLVIFIHAVFNGKTLLWLAFGAT